MTNGQGRSYGAGPRHAAADPLSPFMRHLLEENRRLRHECGRLWLLAFSPKDRADYLLDRFDQAVDATFSSDVDGLLDAAWRGYLASLDDIRTTENLKEAA